ncbi:hypothetical protein [Candidatus Symbiopectobacterium sp.]|uniref:hypothetical protein n=1 Tax=Candidatus Symbiopectobacterium sp. TaxID=2816440 RepID=UPI0025C0BA95|nr:hypothetical protein [Candidatus Symbiopectobacterium sp.]
MVICSDDYPKVLFIQQSLPLRAVLHCIFSVLEIHRYRYIQRWLSDIDGFLQKSSLGSSCRGKKMFKL